MRLLYSDESDWAETVIAAKADKDDISRLFENTDWSLFVNITLETNPENWISVNGSRYNGGFAIILSENGTEYITNDEPEFEQLADKLLDYLVTDGHPDKVGFEPFHAIPDEPSDYITWKEKYETERKTRKFALTILCGLLVLLFPLVYLWFTDELRFIGHETELAVGKVVTAEWNVGYAGRAYYQIVTYEFEFNDSTYVGTFETNQLTGKHYPGDLIRVKFITDSPHVSKRTARLKIFNKQDYEKLNYNDRRTPAGHARDLP